MEQTAHTTPPVQAEPAKGWRGKLKVAAVALAFTVAGWIGQDVYGKVRDALLPGDDPIGRLAEQQQAGFAALEASLANLRGSVGDEGRDALKEVAAATEALERLNRDILAKLRFTEQENRLLQRNLQAANGVQGGHDFLLSEGESMRIDDANVVGLQRLTPSTAWMNFTSTQAGVSARSGLNAGESMAFRNAAGQACKLTLIALRGDVASFAVVCGAATQA